MIAERSVNFDQKKKDVGNPISAVKKYLNSMQVTLKILPE